MAVVVEAAWWPFVSSIHAIIIKVLHNIISSIFCISFLTRSKHSNKVKRKMSNAKSELE